MSVFLDVECAPCARRGVWLVGAGFVIHEHTGGATSACELPPRDDDHLTDRQRAALPGAAHVERRRRQNGAAA